MEIRRAKLSELKDIQNFIKVNWSRNHIFAENEGYLKYEMTSGADSNFLNFLISKNQNEEICGILGFTKSNKDIDNSELFLVMLCVASEHAKHGLAIKMLQEAKSLTNKSLHTVGVASSALPLYKLLGFNTGILNHYAWINQNINEYSLCVPNDKTLFNLNGNSTFKVVKEIDRLQFIDTNDHRKDYFSFRRRYIEHPVFEYQFAYDTDSSSLIVWRVVNHNNAKAIKVIDYFGNLNELANALVLLKSVAIEISAEFVDIYIKAKLRIDISDIGFYEVNYNEFVIPNYFSPFLKENINLNYATCNDDLTIMRGDGDQDRPS